MLIAVILLAWLLINTLATLVIICIDGGTPARASDWAGVGISCILSPLIMLFIIQPFVTWIIKITRKDGKKEKG